MIIFLYLSLATIIGFILYSGSIAVVTSLITFLFVGITISYVLSNRNKNEFLDLLTVFFIAFTSYLFYALLAHISYVEINGFHTNPDQYDFFRISEELGNKNSIKKIFEDCFIGRIHIEQEGAYFLFGTLAFLANRFFDGNSVLFQMINVSFFAILFNLFLYKLLTLYVERKSAFRYTLLFLFLSYNFAYSSLLLRDIHIALFYVIAIYIVPLPFKLRRLISLIALQIITIEFRLEHGIAFSFFPLLYLYHNVNQTKYKKLYFALFTLLIFFISIYSVQQILSTVINITKVIGYYSEYTSTSAEDSGGLGAYLYRLPNGVKQLAVVVYSQISPFPPWNQLLQSKTFLQIIQAFAAGVPPIFWGYVFFISVTNIIKQRKNLPPITIWLLIMMVAFLFANSSNINVRRIMAVYPIMYILFVYTQTNHTKAERVKGRLQYASLYIVLIMIYSVFKVL